MEATTAYCSFHGFFHISAFPARTKIFGVAKNGIWCSLSRGLLARPGSAVSVLLHSHLKQLEMQGGFTEQTEMGLQPPGELTTTARGLLGSSGSVSSAAWCRSVLENY